VVSLQEPLSFARTPSAASHPVAQDAGERPRSRQRAEIGAADNDQIPVAEDTDQIPAAEDTDQIPAAEDTDQIPDAENTDQIPAADETEQNPAAAAALLWSGSPMYYYAKKEVTRVQVNEISNTVLKEFDSHVRPQLLDWCGCCGARILGQPAETMLMTDTFLVALEQTQRTIGCGLTFNNKHYALDERAVNLQEGTVVVCWQCKSDLCAGRVPEFAFVKGLYFSAPHGALPDLTMVERTLIQRSQHFTTLLKVRHNVDCQEPFKGHSISFPHNGPQQVMLLNMPKTKALLLHPFHRERATDH
jgi:hypothetical protein